ncbi:MAG: putative anti-sigma regulatory factor, serine/threonine protein kinase [Acidimicrobiales bacterium]|nr:putative anti-sigma regulatory factor, serine/threonine protein kinase [Acidimicrobiales bacterium]
MTLVQPDPTRVTDQVPVDEPRRRRSFDLGRSLTAATTARHWLALELDDLGATAVLGADALGMAQLMISELVANVVVHTRSNAVAAVELRGRDILVSVSDDDPALPVLTQAELLAPSGRGLQILAKVAASWGVDTRSPVGKAVWFTVDVS